MNLARRDRTLRLLYGLLFVVLWIAGAYYIFGFTTAIYDSGSTIPNGEQVVPYNNHGNVVYITETQYFSKELYGVGIGVFLSLYLILGIILQAVYKVEVFRARVPWTKSSNTENAPPQDAKH